ncbi:hypothetical protein GQ44DRAFT_704152, partial [Phaeosphaeriaceae sp. PMI808]
MVFKVFPCRLLVVGPAMARPPAALTSGQCWPVLTLLSSVKYPSHLTCVCVCVCVLLWPCTLRVWAVTVRQLYTSYYTTLSPFQKPTM